MRRDHLVSSSLISSIFACLLLLGCGSGGSTNSDPPSDNTPTAITGRVLTPDGTLDTAQRSSRQVATGGVTVALGQVDDDGTVVTVFAGARALTNEQGQYSIKLPSGVKLGPRLNVIVGDPADPLLAGICVLATTDLSPAGTAARDALYAAARQNGVKVSALNAALVKGFLTSAGQAAGTTAAGTALTTAVDTAAQKIGASTTAGARLDACVPRNKTLWVSSVSPASAHKDFGLVVVPVTIRGGGFTSLTRLDSRPPIAPVGAIFEPTLVSSTELRGEILIQPEATVGRHTLYVIQLTHAGRQNPGLFGETVAFQFRVLPRAADIDVNGLLPNTVRLTGTEQTLEAFVNISGLNFTTGTRVTVEAPLKVKAVDFFDDKLITAVIEIPPSTKPGAYTFTVFGDQGQKTWDLTILAADATQERPVVNSISPANGAVGDTVTVTLRGSGFEGTPNIIVTPNGVAVTSIQASFGQIKATFQVLGIAAPGDRKVIVQVGNQFSSPLTFRIDP